MRVTSKGQVTIPQPIRNKLGITPAAELDFVEENGRVQHQPVGQLVVRAKMHGNLLPVGPHPGHVVVKDPPRFGR